MKTNTIVTDNSLFPVREWGRLAQEPGWHAGYGVAVGGAHVDHLICSEQVSGLSKCLVPGNTDTHWAKAPSW